MPDLLQVNDLAVSFNVHGGTVDAVRGVSFRVPHAKTVALVGESGSGKTVVSQAIMRILPEVATVPSGEVLFRRNPDDDAIDLLKLDADGARMRSIRGGQMSIIFQEPMTSLSPLHTIGSQVGEALALHREVSKKQKNEITEEMLGLVGFPNPRQALDTYPFELSGGLRQRAMIAMALICRPALLIADEPTTALDVTIQAQILKLIHDLQRELNMAVLMITHDLGVVANIADEVVVMYHGEVMEMGRKEDIFRTPSHPYLKALMRAVPRFNMEKGERLVPIREIKPATGHMLTARGPGEERASGEPLLEVSGLKKNFRIKKQGLFFKTGAEDVQAVDSVDLEIARGECLGLVGESGCGKTTLSKILMRAMPADEGAVTFHHDGAATDVLSLRGPALKRFRRKVQYMFQDPFSSLNPRMTVLDILSEPLTIHGVGDRRHRVELVKELMDLVGLDPRYLNRYPHSFSGGQRQRIGIARALALRPDLVICDEPVSALDVSIQAQILNLLKDLQEQLGLTYLFISHNLAVVDYMADRIAVMCAGRIVETAPKVKMFRNPVHPYTKALVAAVPEPNLEDQLDLSVLMEGKASDPAAWPAPFTIAEGAPTDWIEVTRGHWVRVAHGTTVKELAA